MKVDDKLFYMILHKVFFCFKFYNTEKHNEYTEILYSPLYRDTFEVIRKRYFELNSMYPSQDFHPELKDDSEEYFRVLEIIKAFEPNSAMTINEIESIIMTVIFPYEVSNEIKNYFISLLMFRSTENI